MACALSASRPRIYARPRARRSDRFTVYDGWIPQPGAELDLTAPTGRPSRPAGSRRSGQCPLRYFFRYVLEIEPPENSTIDPDSGSTRSRMGSLVHEVFERFLKELIERGEMPASSAR